MTDEKSQLTACQTPIEKAVDGQQRAHHMRTRRGKEDLMNTLLKRGRILLLLALALAVSVPGMAVAQLSEQNNSQGQSPTFEAPADAQAVPEQLIVKFEENVDPATKADVRRAEGLEKEKDLELIGAEVDKVKGQPVEAAIRALNNRPNVAYAERDYIVHPTGYADEPRFAELWGLHNTGQTGGTANVDVNGLEASGVTQGDPNLVVAVIDTGVDFSHPDLTGRRWVNPGESGGGKETNGIDDDGNGFVDDVNGADFVNNDGDPFDENDHGTHVSGTIAASVNDQGVVGVAPNVKIMALKAIGGSISDAIEAIGYAKSKGAKISNNSWEIPGGFFSQALKDAIDTSGSLFVAAAGNGGSDRIGDNLDVSPNYPAAYTSNNLLSVAAVDHHGNRASFSNFGATSVDISAPGVGILSTIPGTVPGDEAYAHFNGTSMAAPHASGVAALAASDDPTLLSDPVALKNHVMDTGKPLAAMAGITVTGDMVDAEAAVGGDDTTAPRVTSTVPKATATGVAPGANITATFSEAMDASTTDGDPSTINGTTFKLFKAGTTNLIPAVVTYDASAKKVILNPNANLQRGTRYKAAVTTGAEDLAGNQLDQDSSLSGLQQKGWSFKTRN
jgi:subtilisin family serine protease